MITQEQLLVIVDDKRVSCDSISFCIEGDPPISTATVSFNGVETSYIVETFRQEVLELPSYGQPTIHRNAIIITTAKEK